MVSCFIYCAGCEKEVSPKLVDGTVIYPHRPDLADLPFWQCQTCHNYVGCHHKTSMPTKPLGIIATPELRKAKVHIHALIDPLWMNELIKRGSLYARIGDRIGYDFHTAEIKSVDEARNIYRVAMGIRNELVQKEQEKLEAAMANKCVDDHDAEWLKENAGGDPYEYGY